MFAYLASSPGRTSTTDHLVDLLWSDREPEAARHALRQTVFFIRQRFGDDVLRTGGGTVSLAVPVACDRDDFLQAIDGLDHSLAVSIYHGDFLPGFAAPGGAEFERWADLERHRLRSLFVRAAESLARAHIAARRSRDAVTLARRVRDADPETEAAWRLLLECLITAGDTLSALVEADVLERRLQEDGRAGEPATLLLLRSARQQPAVVTGETNAQFVTELVGREAQFSAILAAWQNVRTGQGRHVHLVAPAGFGKTRILHDVQQRLRAVGARVVTVRANPGEQSIGFAMCAELAAGLAALPGATAVAPATAGVLVGLNPALATTYPEAKPVNGMDGDAVLHRSLALAELVACVVDEAPLALLLDDLHWAGDASRAVVASLLERLASHRLLVASASRPRPEALIQREDSLVFVLEPLTPAHVRELLDGAAPLPDEAWAAALPDSLQRAAQGSPLLVLETLQLAFEQNLLACDTDGWQCTDPAALGRMLAGGSALARRIADLNRDQLWLLTLLATEGTPVPPAILAAAILRHPGAISADLHGLEQRALAVRAGADWAPAHDEISTQVLAQASLEAMDAAHLALGLAWAAEPAEAWRRRRAARDLVAARATVDLRRLAARHIRDLRRDRDRRATRLLLRDLMGAGNAELERHLLGAMPVRERFGLTRPSRLATAALLGFSLLASGAMAWRRAHTPFDAELLFVAADSAGREFILSARLRRDDWEEGTPVSLERQRAPVPAALGAGSWAVYRSPQGAWATSVATGDSTVIDVVVFDQAGAPARRLTHALGDDNAAGWSPDGTRVAIVTARWSALSQYEVAVADARTGAVTRVSNDQAHATSPVWSPDGTRLAYTRRFLIADVGRAGEVCWATPDGLVSDCFAVAGLDPQSVVGWRSNHEVLILAAISSRHVTVGVDLRSRTRTNLSLDLGNTQGSGDQRWILAQRLDEIGTIRFWVVAPSDQPEAQRDVALPQGLRVVRAVWGATRPRRYVAAIRLVPPAAAIPVDAPYQLSLRGFDQYGEELDVPVSAWWSSDSSIFSVGGRGFLQPHRRGRATLHVQVAGVHRDSVAIEIGPPQYEPVFTERWGANAEDRWTLYGAPFPLLVTGPNGIRALWNNGEGSFTSGAYLRNPIPAPRGLGLEVLLSTPVTMRIWQHLNVELTNSIQDEDLLRWDHRSNTSGPFRNGQQRNYCAAAFNGEGAPQATFSVVAAGESGRVVAEPAYASGAWYRVRVQIFPDGRCGFAVNGVPLWRSQSPLDLSPAFRVDLAGNSFETRLLFGPVAVWRGVRNDVDWSALAMETTQGSR